MKTTIVILFALLTLAFGLPSASAQGDSQSDFHCEFEFEATVHQGPSAGLSLVGTLQFDLQATGGLNGTFTLKDESAVTAAGQVTGRAVHLIFDLGDGRYIYGVGTSLYNLRDQDCGGALGGLLAGPEPGDSGDWGKGKPGKGVIQIAGDDQSGVSDEQPLDTTESGGG